MGACPEPETPDEMIETLRAMARERGDRLSENERAAISYALRKIKAKRKDWETPRDQGRRNLAED